MDREFTVDTSRPKTRAESRAQAAAAAAHRRRTRLFPLVAVVISVILIVSWIASGSHSQHAASADLNPNAVTTSTVAPAPQYKPPAINPVYVTALRGEGKWVAQDTWHVGAPHIYITHYRTNRSSPSTIAYVSWIRSSSTRLGLYLGYKGPGPTNLSRGPEEVPATGRWNLLATFNSGFYEKDSAGGFYTHGSQYFPMINNRATLVEYKNGTLDVVNWNTGPHVTSDVVMARQNLHILVNNSKVTPLSNQPTAWGVTLHGVPQVWRTGVGVDVQGNLIYVAATNQTAASLAQIFVHVGCVRAMELDINPEWPIFVTYGGANSSHPQLDVPNPNQIASRFLYRTTKDFFAVYARVPKKIETPW